MKIIEDDKLNVLYVFGGEKAQGAEIVIERLMAYNTTNVNPHLIMAPGKFAYDLVETGKTYPITLCNHLKKLNRSSTGTARFYLRALRNYFAVSYFVWKYLRKKKIDIIHANTIVPASYLIPLVWYSKLFKRKLRWVWSDHDLKYFSKIDMGQAKMCLRFYDQTLVVSKAVKLKYGTSEKVSVLYNGLDLNKFVNDKALRNTFRSGLSIPVESLVVGMAASINPDKGYLELINVFGELCEKFPGVQLLLAGNYSDATPDYSASVAAAIALNPKIIYIGFLDKMTGFYNGCDIVINNSNNYRSESLGTTIYEAMACEKVVIASRTGGTPEIITDNRDGLLFETENVQQLKDKLTYALSNYDTLAPLRSAARLKVKERFNIKTMAEHYNRLLVKCL